MRIQWIWVALGGALGSVLRYFVGNTIKNWASSPFPFGTLAINLLGSFLIGFLFNIFHEKDIRPEVWNFLAVGILGGFTTFSTFSLEAGRLWSFGRFDLLFTYCGISSSIGPLLALLGGYLGSKAT